MKAVFFLQTDPFLPKPALRALREADALARAGWQVSFVSWIKDPAAPAPTSPDPFPVRRVKVPVPALGTSFLARMRAYRHAMRELAQAGIAEAPDLIVDHDLEALQAAVLTKRVTGKPLIYDSHEDWPALIAENSRLEAIVSKIQERRLCRHVDWVVTVSDPIADKFRRMGKPTSVLYSARRAEDVQLADRARSREAFGYGSDDFVIGFAGALGAGRGLELLLDAVAQLPSSVKALVVGGPEEEAARLRERAASLRIADRVRVDGYRSFDELGPYYAAMDIGVILLDGRPNHQRALPNKLFDYMANGVAVIVPRYPAMARIVDSSGAGATLSEVAMRNLVDEVKRLLSDSAGLATMKARAREAFVTTYSWDRQEDAFRKILESILPGEPS